MKTKSGTGIPQGIHRPWKKNFGTALNNVFATENRQAEGDVAGGRSGRSVNGKGPKAKARPKGVVERFRRVNEVGSMLASIIEPNDLMETIMEAAADLFKPERAILFVENETGQRMFRRLKGKRTEMRSEIPSSLKPQYVEITSSGSALFLAARGRKNGAGRAMGAPLRIKGQTIGALLVHTGAPESLSNGDLEIMTSLANHATVALENACLYESLKSNYFATIQSLVNALEASDRFTKGHSERVRLLSVELGKFLNLDPKDLELLEQASILHDIGKIGIDTFILQKQGRLTPKEYSLVKAHPLIGDEILGPIGTLDGVRRTIIQHHERHDGAGYPYGLKGDEISYTSRILSVVDTFDAMMTDRPYRKALTLLRVKQELRENSGTQFDPGIVEAFANLLDVKGDELLSRAGYSLLYSR